MLARHTNGDDENQRRCPDHHAQPGQQKADLVGAERIEGEAHDLAEGELRGQLRYCGGNGHLKLDATRCTPESQSGRRHSAVSGSR